MRQPQNDDAHPPKVERIVDVRWDEQGKMQFLCHLRDCEAPLWMEKERCVAGHLIRKFFDDRHRQHRCVKEMERREKAQNLVGTEHTSLSIRPSCSNVSNVHDTGVKNAESAKKPQLVEKRVQPRCGISEPTSSSSSIDEDEHLRCLAMESTGDGVSYIFQNGPNGKQFQLSGNEVLSKNLRYVQEALSRGFKLVFDADLTFRHMGVILQPSINTPELNTETVHELKLLSDEQEEKTNRLTKAQVVVNNNNVVRSQPVLVGTLQQPPAPPLSGPKKRGRKRKYPLVIEQNSATVSSLKTVIPKSKQNGVSTLSEQSQLLQNVIPTHTVLNNTCKPTSTVVDRESAQSSNDQTDYKLTTVKRTDFSERHISNLSDDVGKNTFRRRQPARQLNLSKRLSPVNISKAKERANSVDKVHGHLSAMSSIRRQTSVDHHDGSQTNL